VPPVPENAEEAVPSDRMPPDDAGPADVDQGAEPVFDSPDASTVAAREAGLVAARDLSDTAAYNRWAAGPLAAGPISLDESASRPVWPYVVFALLLVAALASQSLLHFRSELARQSSAAASLYELLGVEVPLPRQADLVSIETSDLQFDAARGLFVLQATLKNRAPYAQAWPALELTLTDTNDAVLVRRVMPAADYLPPGAPAAAFPANGETAVRLWVEAAKVGASGYRLYLFYP
jgi:hypothetical protein